MGIYGHGSHDFSLYTLEVYIATPQDHLAEDFEDVERRYESARTPNVVNEQEKGKPAEKKMNTKIKKVLTKSGLWALLEMFEIIFM